MASAKTQHKNEPIAVIGTGCRFPGGAVSPSKLWDLLKEPKDIAREIPDERFNVDRYYHQDNMHHGTSNVRHSYLLNQNVKEFDANFFGVKPVEALAMDPQQRLLLETVYESLESAGLTIRQLQGSSTGVFVGNMSGDYADLVGHDLDDFPTYFAPGTARSILSNRISYFFDWHGPSVTIDTACSSSLVAVHQAVQSLRSGETTVAVAAGTNLLLGPNQYIAESKLKMLSPTGRSRMWDEAADGYARGEGIASIILKTLSSAIADGDQIECLIRETGTNQDGRTKGITMPSPIAQAALIRSTYERAGLDLGKPQDRPQYFEAHGTGTPAGDPVEAEAISTAFFGSTYIRKPEAPKLIVGSIKTIIGHTEGTAGLASLIKVSQALKHSQIPPNLHLNRLNPNVKPFYDNLQIAQELLDWPEVASGTPRRASVNSFGFGGANAHAIIESYTPTQSSFIPLPGPVYSPFVFSAASDDALSAMLKSYAQYIRANPEINLHDLAYTLSSRRSMLSKRTSISALDKNSLCDRLESRSEVEPSAVANASKPLKSSARILGIFTGQGAQWARMGAELIELAPKAKGILELLEQSLDDLPVNDRPSWSLTKELLAAKESRLHLAELSQPVCTAVQIVLVELLRSAGITFKAVVGHSSGEIAAAYAAGIVSASDAIRIAYYRGFHLHHSQGNNGQTGAMMAAGTSYADAKELCELEIFEGRLTVAACNSPSSVTISGDADAIEEAKEILDAEEKFARKLKVDKAYHSHHMDPCSAPYIQSLQQCGIKADVANTNDCVWVSSVFEDDISNVTESLCDTYWAKNMVQPVLFAQALSFALSEQGPFDLALEVGPHPALKGPVSDVIKEITGDAIPYAGCLHRGKNSAEAFSEGLGFIWSSLGGASVDVVGYDAFMSGVTAHTMLKELPHYPWSHEHEYYHESRVSKALRLDQFSPNELLGTRTPEAGAGEIRWKNRLSPKEVPWLKHHQVQGEIIFPGAGYISSALEAVKQAFASKHIRLVDIKNFVIGQALRLDESGTVDTLVSLARIRSEAGVISAYFTFSSQEKRGKTNMAENATASIVIMLGASGADTLPQRPEPDFQMLDMEHERFYLAVERLGFGYTGPFNAITNVQRKLDVATGCIGVPESTLGFSKLVFHPAALDCAIQSVILAYCFPGDTRLRTVQLPIGIDSIRFNLDYCDHAVPGSKYGFRSTVPPGESSDINGDVDIFAEDGQTTLVQLQGLHTKSLVPPSAENDLQLFAEFVWKPETPLGRNLVLEGDALEVETDLFYAIERVAYFYLRLVDDAVPQAERASVHDHFHMLFNYIDNVFARITKGELPHLRQEWAEDSHRQILEIVNSYPDSIDIQLMHSVGESLPGVIKSQGESNILESMVKDNMLNRFYVDALGMARYMNDLTRMLGELNHRFPHMHILEVGAGTGGATKVLLRELNDAYASYTYTDISSGFFPQAREVFQEQEAKMIFKTLNIEKDCVEQGYEENSYDVIIANLVVHATQDLEKTMNNLRGLLKPGGYLILLEICDNDPLRFGFIFGTLPGWWLGKDEGRVLSPCISVPEWDQLMRKTGFSGADAVTPHDALCPLSVIVTQAVDDRIDFLRQPLSPSSFVPNSSRLTIIGAATSETASLAKAIKELLHSHYADIAVVNSVEDLLELELPVMGSVISLADLDSPIFEKMTAMTLKGLQHIFIKSKNVFWITRGCQDENPFSNMMVGVGRNIVLEMKHVRLQFLDIDASEHLPPSRIASMCLIFELSGDWEQNGKAGQMLWYSEPEMRLKCGQLLVPRIRLSKDRNMRYNSARRNLTQNLDPKAHPLAISRSDSVYTLKEDYSKGASKTRTDTVTIAVTHSVLSSIKLPSSDYLFLVLGKDTDSDKKLIAFADSQKSLVEVDREWTIQSASSGVDALSLVHLYEEVMSQTLIAGLPSGTSLVVLNAADSLLRALINRGAESGVVVASLSTRKPAAGDSHTLYVHPLEPARLIVAKIPRNARRYIDLSEESTPIPSIARSLPSHCEVLSLEDITSSESLLTRSSLIGIDGAIPRILKTAWAHVNSNWSNTNLSRKSLQITKVKQLNLIEPIPHGVQLVDWTESGILPTQLKPADAMVSFKGNRTYWLVGLSGSLGLSLCRWMIDRGARYIAITSRNPRVDPKWLNEAEASGATVRIFPNDITNAEAVSSAFKVIDNTMPPIAGVVQGAMVLRDAMFADMTLDTMEQVIKPKVQGSLHLDKIFHDTPLDFFVFLSSIACVAGNPGQSMYAAANLFMTAIANQRRKRGVAASAAHIGAIMGNGYVTRELTLAQQGFLQDVGNTWMSEQDFFTIIAEAILASSPNSSMTIDSVTGLQLQYAEKDISWFSNPMFQHLVIKTGAGGSTALSKSKVSLRDELQHAKSTAEVSEILNGMHILRQYALVSRIRLTRLLTTAAAFVAKLRSSLQTDSSRKIDDVPLEELGMDSLIAVDIRSWFLKELTVDVPILKILGNGTAVSLVEYAQEMIPQSLLPSLSDAPSPPAKESKSVSLVVPDALSVARSLELSSDQSDIASTRPAMLVPPSDFGSSRAVTPTIIVSDDEAEVSSATDVSSEMSMPEVDTCNPVQAILPMSFGQSRFWFLRSYLEDQTAFNITTVIRISGPLRVDDFGRAVHAVGQRHEALRTSFSSTDNVLRQTVRKHSTLKLEHSHVANNDEIERAHQAISSHVYDLEGGEIMKVHLLSKSAEEHALVLGYHHINMDGVSFEVFFSDLHKAYEGIAFTENFIQYPAFSQRERKEYETGKWSKELSFWRSEFPDLPEPLPLLSISNKVARTGTVAYGTRTLKRRVGVELSERIKDVCKKFKTTPFQFYLNVFKAILARHSDVSDICIGVADANRKDADTMEALGLYLNLLPLRTRFQPAQKFTESLKEVQRQFQNCFANSRVPFDVLLNELNVPRSSTHTPLFQVFMNYRQGVQEARSFCGCDCEGELLASGQSAYDISMDIVDNPGGEALVMLATQQHLYDTAEADLLLDDFFSLLEAFSMNPASRLTRPLERDNAVIRTVLGLGRGEALEYAWPDTLVHRIEEVSMSTPDAIALKDASNTSLTYSEMIRRVNSIASAIGTSKEGQMIGVFQDPTPSLICSIIAIWKIGATYIPLDSRLGIDRLRVMVQECKPALVLIDSTTERNFPALESSSPSLNVEKITIDKGLKVTTRCTPDAIAAVLYTSGSTGTPKGIMLQHSAFKNNLEAAIIKFQILPGSDVVLQQSAFSFDMSLAQTFMTLCSGNTLVVVPRHLRGDASAIAELIDDERVTVTEATPSEHVAWMTHGLLSMRGSKLRVIISGGEKVNQAMVTALKSLELPNLRAFDAYGPTELTFNSHYRVIEYRNNNWASTPLQVFPNYSTYIMDQHLNPLPAGVSGEICVGGAAVALGYLHSNDITTKRFPHDKFATAQFTSMGWTRMHRTGDRGRLDAKGGLLLEGRIADDTQVKLRGLRMDLQEIESCLLEASDGFIKHAAVSMRQDSASGHDFLVAHVILNHGLANGDQAAFLLDLPTRLPLPQYMRPSLLVPIADIPMTSSNKLDRRALADLSIQATKVSQSTELTSTQHDISQLWRDIVPSHVFDHYTIKPATDFFQVGGSSLLLVNLQNRLRQKYGEAPLLHKLFEFSTLQGMASLVENVELHSEVQIDWEDEAAIPPDFEEMMAAEPVVRSPQTARVVVLTGATGFLGQQILKRLVEASTVDKVHCLAVRKRNDLPPLFRSSKVKVHFGDLGIKDFGLPQQILADIFSEADSIIHNGADVSFMKTYSSLKRTNVDAAKQLVKLCLPRRTVVHFISSASVTQLTGLDEVGEVSVSPYPPQVASDGYTAGKWVSERFLEKIHARFGLPIWIHRPSSITGDGANDLDLMNNLFKYVELQEAVPESPAWKGYFDFISVHSVAGAIVKSVTKQDARKDNVSYSYESGEIEYSLRIIKEMTEGNTELPVKSIPMAEWVNKAEELGMNKMLVAYLRSATETNIALAFPRLIKGTL